MLGVDICQVDDVEGDAVCDKARGKELLVELRDEKGLIITVVRDCELRHPSRRR